MLLQIPGVLVDALAVEEGHPATQASQDRGPLVAPEVHAAVAVQLLEETLQGEYMEVERRELEQRRNGQLGRAIGRALPGESHEELERIAEEDQRKAERGLVELRSGDEVWYKHIDEITRDDRQARIESENARAAWIQERLRRQPRPQRSKRDTEPSPRFVGSIFPAYFGPFFSPGFTRDLLCEGGVLLVVMWSATGNLAPGGRHRPGSSKGEGEWTVFTGCKTEQGYIQKRSRAYPTGGGSCCFSCCTRETVTSAWTNSPRGSAVWASAPSPPMSYTRPYNS